MAQFVKLTRETPLYGFDYLWVNPDHVLKVAQSTEEAVNVYITSPMYSVETVKGRAETVVGILDGSLHGDRKQKPVAVPVKAGEACG